MDPTPNPPDDGEPDQIEARHSVGDPVLRKTRLLSRQCQTCVFRPGNLMHLHERRLRDLVAEARANEGFIVCHSTLSHYLYPDAKPAICRGFADRYTTQALQVIQQLWGFVEVDPPGEPPAPSTDPSGSGAFGAEDHAPGSCAGSAPMWKGPPQSQAVDRDNAVPANHSTTAPPQETEESARGRY
jgi:hypothetical protein